MQHCLQRMEALQTFVYPSRAYHLAPAHEAAQQESQLGERRRNLGRLDVCVCQQRHLRRGLAQLDSVQTALMFWRTCSLLVRTLCPSLERESDCQMMNQTRWRRSFHRLLLVRNILA